MRTTSPHTTMLSMPVASHVDFPQMARIIELADNHDGTVSIFTTLIESNAPYQADYDTTDPDGLASLYREFGANDIHTRMGRLGTSVDHNTECHREG